MASALYSSVEATQPMSGLYSPSPQAEAMSGLYTPSYPPETAGLYGTQGFHIAHESVYTYSLGSEVNVVFICGIPYMAPDTTIDKYGTVHLVTPSQLFPFILAVNGVKKSVNTVGGIQIFEFDIPASSKITISGEQSKPGVAGQIDFIRVLKISGAIKKCSGK